MPPHQIIASLQCKNNKVIQRSDIRFFFFLDQYPISNIYIYISAIQRHLQFKAIVLLQQHTTCNVDFIKPPAALKCKDDWLSACIQCWNKKNIT